MNENLQQAELEKIKAETKKIEKETADISRFRLFDLSTEAIKIFAAAILGIGGFVAAITQHELAELKATNAKKTLEQTEQKVTEKRKELDEIQLELKQARIEREDVQVYVDSLKSNLSESTAIIEEAQPEKFSEQLVYVQFQGSLSRDLINSYRSKLTQSGYKAPGAERKAGTYKSEVRYFKAADRAAADKLAEVTRNYFIARECPLPLAVILVGSSGDVPPPQLEVWIHHSCK